jgi:hypothetical protein
MAIDTINIGAIANDGTGETIRSAFQTVNENFSFVQGGLFAGTEQSIINAISIVSQTISTNSFVTGSLVGNTVTSNGNLFVSSNGAFIIGNVNIVGNLTVSGSQSAAASQSTDAAMINLHYPAAPPLITDDGKDVGLTFKYYKGAESLGFFGWRNSTRSFVYLDSATEVGNVITTSTFGNVHFGQLLVSNTTAATSNVTGALQVRGGVGIAGNLHANVARFGNLTVLGYHVGSLNFAGGDTIFINGSPVVTSATAFNGGTVGLTTLFACTNPSTSTTTGAVRITGGLGVAGNTNLANLTVVSGGNVRANIIGNIFSAAQPYVTSLGTLTGLTVGGQTIVRDVVPEVNLTYQLGTGGSSRWAKIWTFDLDVSGILSGATINSTGGSHSGNLAINTPGAAGLTTNSAVAEIFDSNATEIRIGQGGQTQFRNIAAATSAATGAVVVTGGLGVGNGLYNSGVHESLGNIVAGATTISTDATTGALVVKGGVGISGNVFTSGWIMPTANVSQNIGSSTNWWNLIYGESIHAQYADLAEKYTADSDYAPATVVVFGGDQEITVTNTYADTRVAGVISSNPAYLMNAAGSGLPVALRGRVPVQVLGPVSKGDLLVTSTQPGFAQSVGQVNTFGAAVFAKSLQTDGRNGIKIIEAVII